MTFLTPTIQENLESRTGISLGLSCKKQVNDYIGQRLSQLSIGLAEFERLVAEDRKEFEALVNEATINETYFFRESSQFDFFRAEFFPARLGKKTRIWCGACSTGEEPYSVLALADSMGMDTDIYASDIDSRVLEAMGKGEYSANSFRKDGDGYRNLIEQNGEFIDGKFVLSERFRSKVRAMKLNLNERTNWPFTPESLDAVILRNVFIYFPRQVRDKILRNIHDILKPEAIIVLSVNEIASIDCNSEIGQLFEKCQWNEVYYLKKKKSGEESKCLDKGTDTSQADTGTMHGHGNAGFHEFEVKLRQVNGMKAGSDTRNEEMNPLPHAKSASLEETVRKVLDIIGSGDLERASEELDSFNFRAQNAEYSMYLKGIIAWKSGETESALDCFEKSGFLNREFWPSIFMKGIMLRNLNRTLDSKPVLSECLNILRKYVNSGKVCYNFIMDSFSPDYFISLCETFLSEERED